MAKKPTYEELEQRVKELENETFERKKAAEELIKSEKLYKEAQSLAHIGHWDYEPHEDSLTWSDELYSILEIDKDAGPLSIEAFIERIHPEDRDTIRGQIEKGEGYRSEYGIVMDNGSVKHIREEVLIVRQEDDKILITKGTAQDITKQKQTQEALRESEQKYRQLLNHAPAGIYEVDFVKQKFVNVNDVMCEYSGYTREEMLSMSPSDILTEDSKRLFSERFAKLFAGEPVTETVEFKTQAKDGREFWVLLNSNFLYENGKPKGATVVVHDITDRKVAEEALRERDERYTALFDRSLDCIYIHDFEGNFIDANPAALKLFGYTKEEILSLNFASLLSQDQMSLALQTLEEIKKDGFQTDVTEFKITTKNGDQIYIETKASLLYHDGEPYAIQGIGRDTTDRKRAEEALQESEEKARQYLDIAGVAFVALDNEGNITLINKRGLEILGYQRGELLGKNWFKTCLPDRFQKDVLDVYHQLIRGEIEPVEYYENPVLTKDGKERIIAWHNSVLRNPVGEIVGALASGEDITERLLAEEALRESEKRLRIILDSIQAGVIIIDVETRTIVDVNPAATKLIGVPKEQIIGQVCHNYICPAEKGACPVIDLGQKVDNSERTLIKANGEEVPILKTVTPILLGGKECLLDSFFDLTEKKKLEAQLQQALKMEAMGTLAGGIAHDFNNLLMAIQGRASIMLMKKDSSDPDFGHLRGIEDNIESASDLTRQLLGFARGGKYEVRPTDINELIKKENRMFGRTKKEITIRGKYEENLWSVEVDRGQIEQVLLNLYVNAWQAMPGGGDLNLETENVTLDENYVKLFAIEPGRYVKISVTDTGVGMDKATQEKIFEPFFTTKEMGRGTGLGLASVYGIIKNHGGFINVYSEKGHGTIFNIYLPASEKGVIEEKKSAGDTLRGSETVLFVDDEDMIIEIAEELFEQLGYKVLIARSGREAIETYEKNKDHIDIVLLDMIMPDMSGSDTYDRMKKIDPDIKVLLFSGYSIDGQATEILDRGCNGFIQKPFKMKELSQKLREILGKV